MKNPVGNKILPCSVAFYNRLNQVFGHIGVIGKKLFCVFWQAITAIAETRIIVMCSDTRVKTNAVDDCLRIQTFHLGIRIQFVEVTDT